MSSWMLLAMAGVAAAVLGWLGPSGATRLRSAPASVASMTSATNPRWTFVIAGAGMMLVGGWLFVPSGAAWVLPVLAIPGGVAGHHIGRRVPSQHAKRAAQQRQADLPTALELLGTCLQAGLPLSAATVAVRDAVDGPVHDDLSRVLQHLDIGVPQSDAWLSLAEQPQWRSLARDLARSSASGTGLVEVLHRAAQDARDAQHAEQLTRARTAGVRSVLPLMVCYLPAFLLLGIVPIVGSAVVRLLG